MDPRIELLDLRKQVAELTAERDRLRDLLARRA